MYPMEEQEEFWEVQKILEEFNRDAITPIMGSGPHSLPGIINDSEKLIPNIETETIIRTTPCYICGIKTKLKLSKGSHPICEECISVHLINNE